MLIKLSVEDFDKGFHVDRDSTRYRHGREGFDITIGNTVRIHIDDELYAEQLGKAICERLGVTLPERHAPLNLPADRSARIERACNADEGCISAGAVQTGRFIESEYIAIARKAIEQLSGGHTFASDAKAALGLIAELAKLLNKQQRENSPRVQT
jgi:hypothetical protein